MHLERKHAFANEEQRYMKKYLQLLQVLPKLSHLNEVRMIKYTG